MLLSSSLPAQSLTIAAAADLTPLQTPLSSPFHPPPTWSFGSSGLLARQIRAGAPFDVYLSANEAYVRDLATDGFLLADTVRIYATGRLGLWSLSGKLKSTHDLLDPSVHRIAIPNPAHAPYGVAAEQLLRHEKLWDRLQPKLALGENVREAFQFASTGNADAVLTSWTLMLDQGGILLSTGYDPIRQSGAVVKGTKNEAAARAFLNYLSTPEGRKTLTRFGLFQP